MDDALRSRLEGTGYVATKLIGKGGMGAVYEATDRRSGEVVVVKLLHEGSSDPQLVERMRIEAEVVARLDHAHIVRVLDYGKTPLGEPFIVMERLVGRTLTAELRARKTLPLGEAYVAANALLGALEYAHERGVIHRDVKLDNIFLHEIPGGSRLKLLDFGIAKLREHHLGVAPSQHPTQEGMVLGTIRYAAPEQLMSQPVDARTDVYAAAVVFFALVAGRRPFEQREQLDVMRAQLVDPAPLLSSVAKQAVSAALDAVVAKALAKRPADRYASAGAFARALREVMAPPVDGVPSVAVELPRTTVRMTPAAPRIPPVAPTVDVPKVGSTVHATVVLKRSSTPSPGAVRSVARSAVQREPDHEAAPVRPATPWWFTLAMAFILTVGALLIALMLARHLGYVGWQRGLLVSPLMVEISSSPSALPS